jgi:phosphohistidine phosphatase SixA
MELILIRHAKAFERDASAWPDDSRRPLTSEGSEQFARVAKRLRRLRPEVDLVESSGFVRAWRTALLLEEHARWPKPVRAERLEIREGSAECSAECSAGVSAGEAAQHEAMLRTITALRSMRVVAWVGHEPMLSRFASRLLAGSPEAVAIDFRKGAALALEIEFGEGGGRADGPAAGTARQSVSPRDLPRARLSWMLTPSVVRRLTK